LRDGHVTGVQTCALPISDRGDEKLALGKISSGRRPCFMVSMKLEDAQVHRMRLIPGLQLQVILLILSGAPGLASANGTRCCRIGEYRWSKLSRHRLRHGC